MCSKTTRERERERVRWRDREKATEFLEMEKTVFAKFCQQSNVHVYSYKQEANSTACTCEKKKKTTFCVSELRRRIVRNDDDDDNDAWSSRTLITQ